MIKQFKKCDRCKAEGFDSELQLFEISVHCKNLNPDGRSNEAFPRQQWCRECVSVTALLGISEKEAEERRQKSLKPAIPITFEDLIREIAYDEACAAISNR